MGGTHTDSHHAVTYQKTAFCETDINIAYYLDLVLLATDRLCSVCGMAAAITDTVVNQRAMSHTSKLLYCLSATYSQQSYLTENTDGKCMTSAAVSLGELLSRQWFLLDPPITDTRAPVHQTFPAGSVLLLSLE